MGGKKKSGGVFFCCCFVFVYKPSCTLKKNRKLGKIVQVERKWEYAKINLGKKRENSVSSCQWHIILLLGNGTYKKTT